MATSRRTTRTWRTLLSAFLVRPLLGVQAQQFPPILFQGRLLNDLGQPIHDAQVQFWQTDQNGNYNHPDDAGGTSVIVPTFQYFGTATTDANGTFQFKTYRPGLYTSRPITHIHYKVWVNNNDVLTSQFYFSDESAAARYPESLILDLLTANSTDSQGSVFVTNKTVVVNLGLGGSEPATPTQVQGPFYPVVNFFSYDSDLTSTDELSGTPSPVMQPSPVTTTSAPTMAPSPVTADPTAGDLGLTDTPTASLLPPQFSTGSPTGTLQDTSETATSSSTYCNGVNALVSLCTMIFFLIL